MGSIFVHLALNGAASEKQSLCNIELLAWTFVCTIQQQIGSHEFEVNVSLLLLQVPSFSDKKPSNFRNLEVVKNAFVFEVNQLCARKGAKKKDVNQKARFLYFQRARAFVPFSLTPHTFFKLFHDWQNVLLSSD